MSKRIIELSMVGLIVFVLMVFVSSIYAYTNSKGIEDNLLRLHVIANSDSPEDQKLKLDVRDKIIDYFGKNFADCKSKEEMESIVSKDIDNIKKYVEMYLENIGKVCKVQVELGKSIFPTKNYGLFTVPTGEYDALRVILGEGEGKNWWCVLFPPLCMADASVVKEDRLIDKNNANRLLKQKLTPEEYALITSSNSENMPVKFKFKLVEIFQDSKIKISMLKSMVF